MQVIILASPGFEEMYRGNDVNPAGAKLSPDMPVDAAVRIEMDLRDNKYSKCQRTMQVARSNTIYLK